MSSLNLAIKQSCDQICHRKQKALQPARALPRKLRFIGMGFNLLARINLELAAKKLSEFWFTVFQPKPKDWVHDFWDEADHSLELHLSDKTIPVRLWGRGPLVVCMHGWGGSGTQFRQIIPALVNAGFQVATFDAPSHGFNPGRTTNVLEFAQCLIAIQQQVAPIHTVMAHSFGAMATLTARYHGLENLYTVFIAPGLNVQEIFSSYAQSLNLNPALVKRFHYKVGRKMSAVANIDDVWNFFTPANLLKHTTQEGLLIFDDNDEELSLQQFNVIKNEWKNCEYLQTHDLGHFRILKDETVINKLTDYMKTLPR